MTLITFSYYATNVVYSIFIHEELPCVPLRRLWRGVILPYLFPGLHFAPLPPSKRCNFKLQSIYMECFFFFLPTLEGNCDSLKIFTILYKQELSKFQWSDTTFCCWSSLVFGRVSTENKRRVDTEGASRGGKVYRSVPKKERKHTTFQAVLHRKLLSNLPWKECIGNN